jgi:hypothetical protein
LNPNELAGNPAADRMGKETMIVNRFVISVAREREARAGEPNATITVEVSEGRALATELNVRAGKGGSLDPASLPVLDVLMRALSADEAPATRRTAARRTAARQTAALETATEPVEGGAAAAPVPSPRRRSSRSKVAAAKRGRRAASAPESGRAYRRMPEPDEVLAAYQQVGTISGLADHFAVPLHTVKGWARRLRQMGYEFAR